jgi:peptidoglycan/LPS O-acetylase OafA/YrhL
MKDLTNNYRPEIDILRAFAVLSVVINHYFPSLLPGGFLGVDIFFVISGFLITSHLINEESTHSFSFLNFYKRRIKRILPALFFMLTVVSILSVYLLLPPDLRRYSDSLKSVVLYFSNFYFANHYDYFSQNTKEFPLLHTWSLSVEEQFYFILPFFIFLTFKYVKKERSIFFALIGLTLTSLLFAQVFSLVESYKTISYYSLLTRFFEMSIGSCAAFYYQKLGNFKLNQRLNNYILINFLVIIFYFFAFNEKLTHPSLLVLPLLLATSLFLITPKESGFFVSINRAKPVIWVGKISYSLYLWHWPLLAFYNYAFFRLEYRHYDKLALILLSFILASLSHYLIENPLRYNKYGFKKSFTLYLAIPSTVFLTFTYFIKHKHGYLLNKYTKETVEVENMFLAPNFCYNHTDNSCVIGAPNSIPKALLFGDSHAGHYIALFDEIGKTHGFSIAGVSAANCYPLFNLGTDLPSSAKKSTVPVCYEIIKKLTAEINNYSTIILAGRWSSLFDENYQKEFPFAEQLKINIQELMRMGKKVILLQQIPELTEPSFNYSVRRSLIFNTSTKFERSYAEELGNEKILSLIQNYPAVSIFSYSNTPQINLSSLPFYNNKFIYSDFSHLKESGARHLAKELGPLFVENYLIFVK